MTDAKLWNDIRDAVLMVPADKRMSAHTIADAVMDALPPAGPVLSREECRLLSQHSRHRGELGMASCCDTDALRAVYDKLRAHLEATADGETDAG